MKEKTVVFIGHSNCNMVNEKAVSDSVSSLIKDGYNTFLCGGMGEFDMLGARTAHAFKIRYPEIKVLLVIPYLNFNIKNKNYFDEVIYPSGLEKFFFKSAIIKRNRYMVENSSAAFCYVNHDWGGAAKTFEYAVEKGLKIINLGSYFPERKQPKNSCDLLS